MHLVKKSLKCSIRRPKVIIINSFISQTNVAKNLHSLACINAKTRCESRNCGIVLYYNTLINEAYLICENYWEKMQKQYSKRRFRLLVFWIMLAFSETNEPIYSLYTLSLPPENIKNLKGFLMLSRSRERMYWNKCIKRIRMLSFSY